MKPPSLNAIGILLIIVFVLKIVYLLFFVHTIRVWEDQAIAENIIHTGNFFINMDGVNNHSFQFPIYPFIIASLYFIFGIHPIIACIYNVCLNIAAGFVFIALMKEIAYYFNLPAQIKIKTTLLITLLVYLLHPAINFYTLYNVHPFMQNMFFLMLSTWLSFRCARKLSYQNSLVFGFVLGLSILDRGTALMALIPFLLIVLDQKKIQTAIRHFFIIGFVSFLVCLPWMIHNYIKDDFVGLESSAGKDMVKGVLEGSEGSNYLSNGDNYYSAFTRAEMDAISKMSVDAQNNYYMDKVYAKWKTQPGFAVKMYLLKLKNFWWFRRSVGSEQSHRIQKIIPIYKTAYLVMIILLLASFYYIGKKSWILLSIPIAISLLQAAFYVETRHRILVEPILIFMAAITFQLVISQKRASTYKKHVEES